MARDGLAGEGGGVQLRGALEDDAVDGHALAGLDHDDVAHGNLVGAHLRQAAIALHVGKVRRDVHHGGDGLAALAHGVGLEDFSHLVEEHDGRALGHVWLGLGEEHHGKRADGGHRHEEVLVKDLAVANVAPGLLQDVVAGYGIGDEEQRKARVHRACGAKEAGEKPELVCGQDRKEHGQRHADAPRLVLQRLLLLALLFLVCLGNGHGSLPG